MNQPRLRVGIIGAGRHGSRYARHAAHDVVGLQLQAICRRNEVEGRALADELGCGFTTDARDLCTRDDLDAVIFVTVPSLLDELVPLAANAGKRLLIEKPVARDLASGRRALDAIERSGAYCMAGHTLRFNTVVRAIRDRVAGLGRLDSLVFSQRFPPQLQLPWLDDPARSGGGSIVHTGVHCFDLIRFLTGLEPAAVACAKNSTYTKLTEDNFACTMTMQHSSALALVTCSRTSQVRNGLIEISGENGQLVGDHVSNRLVEITAGGPRRIEVGEPRMTVLETLRRFAADFRQEAAPAIGYRDGLRALAVADACLRACKSGRFEPVAYCPS